MEKIKTIKLRSNMKIKTEKFVLFPIENIEESNLNILPYNYE